MSVTVPAAVRARRLRVGLCVAVVVATLAVVFVETELSQRRRADGAAGVAPLPGANATPPTRASWPPLEQGAPLHAIHNLAVLPPRLVSGPRQPEVAVVFFGPFSTNHMRHDLHGVLCEFVLPSRNGSEETLTSPFTLTWVGDGHQKSVDRLTYTLHCGVPVDAFRTALAAEQLVFPNLSRPLFADWALSSSLQLRLNGPFRGRRMPVQVPHTWPEVLDRTLAPTTPGQVVLCFSSVYHVPHPSYTYLHYLPEVIEYYLDQGMEQIVLPLLLADDAGVPPALAALMAQYASRLLIINATNVILESSAWYHGQVGMMVDCMNRFRDRPRLVLIGDVDELFWSGHDNLTLSDRLRAGLAPGLAAAWDGATENATVPVAIEVREYNFVVGLCPPPFNGTAAADRYNFSAVDDMDRYLRDIDRHGRLSPSSWTLLQYRRELSNMPWYRTKYAVVSTMVVMLQVHHPSLYSNNTSHFASIAVTADPSELCKLHASSLGVRVSACSAAVAAREYNATNAFPQAAGSNHRLLPHQVAVGKRNHRTDSRVRESPRYQALIRERVRAVQALLRDQMRLFVEGMPAATV